MEASKDIRIISEDEAATRELARSIGTHIKGGEVIELAGDVGSGKTVFVKGLAEGMGIREEVSSPSFTISNEYRSDKLTLVHYDFYRLSDPGIMAQEIVEQLGDKQTVVAIEWPEIIEGVLPHERIILSFAVPAEQKREICMKVPKELEYLVPIIYLTR